MSSSNISNDLNTMVSSQQPDVNQADEKSGSGIAVPLSPPTTTNTATTATNIQSSSELLDEARIKSILISDSSLEILLSRLKQSIKTSEEFATFIKKKHLYESNYIREMKKVSTNVRGSLKTTFVGAGSKSSIVDSFDRIVSFDEGVIKDVREPYVKALERMYEELSSLASSFSVLRKNLKEEGQKKEKHVVEIISAADKARQKYRSLCQELEKLRNSSNQNQKKLTIKGTKTGTQQEEELTRKIENADSDYKNKAQSSQLEKKNLIEIHRPRISKSLKDLILEIDSAFALQLAKYSTFSESLVIGLGNNISPLNNTHSSMKSFASSIDVERNLYNYLKGARSESKDYFVPVEYKRHIIFGGSASSTAPKPRAPPRTFTNNNNKAISAPTLNHSVPKQTSFGNLSLNQNSAQIPNTSSSTAAEDFYPAHPPTYDTTMDSQDSAPSSAAYSTLDPTRTNGLSLPTPPQSQQQQTQIPSTLDANRSANAVPRQDGHGHSTSIAGPRAMSQDYDSSIADNSDNSITNSYNNEVSSSSTKLFGVPIEYVAHDDEMIPLFVKKCISLIEQYGENSEGIYRSSPNAAKVEELKNLINNDPLNFALLEPADPNNVSDDYVYCMASLLKLFFASLPNPLLTRENSPAFLRAAEVEDVTTMHVHLHRAVFELPDACYFTLRDLLFHFTNISNMPKVRMNVKNLSIVWCNNLLGSEFTSKEEFEIQQRVVAELIVAAPAIFNPKED